MQKIIVMQEHELEEIVLNSLKKFGLKPEEPVQKVLTINQAAKKLGMAHNTIKKLVLSGILRSTKSGRIPEDAINDYLAGK